ncbi:hypothetical protein HPB50_026207 [Hyalomma asiaticum]|uniref:Uncharacterized protein n=1 Tax=Hyalomma asiaticum TaxID=266040 RepID=A0ACB7SR95_HYAAI|nr:hypothetical protein HPB50_026207 [Hyalomma asiaticum]
MGCTGTKQGSECDAVEKAEVMGNAERGNDGLRHSSNDGGFCRGAMAAMAEAAMTTWQQPCRSQGCSHA